MDDSSTGGGSDGGAWQMDSQLYNLLNIFIAITEEAGVGNFLVWFFLLTAGFMWKKVTYSTARFLIQGSSVVGRRRSEGCSG